MSDKEFEDQLAQVKQSLKAAEYDKAALVGLRLVAARPEDAEPYNLLGLMYVYAGEYEMAQELFTAAVLLDPKSARAYVNLGYTYLSQGDPDLALAALDAAKKLRPSKDVKSALEQYVESAKQAIQHREETTKKSYDEGKALFGSSRFNEAVAKFKAAVRLKDSSAYWWLGHCHRRLGKLHEALRAFDKAVLLRPTVHDNCYGKGLALRDLRQYEDAIEAFKKSSELHKKKHGKDHYESWVGIADCYRRLGKTSEAAEAQRKAQGLR
jgi:tetratricopeptide (TPR) repeat protein